MAILHDGTDSIIDNQTGNLFLRSGSTHLQSLTGENKIVAEADGQVELYYDNSKKLSTETYGVSLHGLTSSTAGNILYYNSSTGQVTYQAPPTGGIPASGGTFTGDVGFSGGAGAINVNSNSDIRFTNGNWTGNATKIQNHSKPTSRRFTFNQITLELYSEALLLIDGMYKMVVDTLYQLQTTNII